MAIDENKEAKATAATKKQPTPRKINDDTEVTLISNCKGKLFYKSLTNVIREWGEQGDEQEMTVKELKEMKAQQSIFFSENWIIFPESQMDIIKHLKIEKHYTNVIFPEDIDAIFEKPVEEFEKFLDGATTGTKSLILGKAREKYESKELVNAHIIRLIEDKMQASIDINNPR